MKVSLPANELFSLAFESWWLSVFCGAPPSSAVAGGG